MSDQFFDNYNFNHNSEPEKKAPETDPAGEQPVSAAPDTQRSAQEPDMTEKLTRESQPVQRTYTDIYANSADARQQVQQKQENNPYISTYRTVGAASVTEPIPDKRTSKPASDYSDGYYHQRFSGQDGNHVNYTRPVSQTAQSSPYAQSSHTAQTSYTAPNAQTAQQTSRHYTTRMAPQEQPRKRKEKSGRISKGGIALLLVVCVLISAAAGFGGSMLAGALNQPKYESTTNDTMVIHKVDTEAQVAGTENLVDKTTSEITAEVADSVVEITTEVMQTSSYYGQYIAQGAGSGVIISSDGYILTNNHVIEGASSIKVTTRSGDTYDATLQGTDSKVDIALLKIDATDLPTAVFGDSDTLEVGSKAVIIGNPLGTLGGSVTEGIISALDRTIDIDGKTMHLLQTDAAVNPGNSGGGMFNGQGELAGIVVAKSSSEEIDNIGFVIPINNVLDILGDLKDYGYVRGRADTGMEFIDLTNQMYAWYYYGNNETGVYISSVDSGSNAEKAGFRKGDRVVSVDGKEITSVSELESIISEKSAGDKVSIVVSRSGSTGTLDLTLSEEIPEDVQKNSSTSKSDSADNSLPNGGGQQQNPEQGNPFSGLFGGR